MINITNIENTLYQWVSGVTGLTTIFANPNAPRPTDPYALINIISTTPVGVEESESTLLPNTSVDVEYSNLELVMVSINTYYSGAHQTATKIKDSLGRVTSKAELFAGGLGYSRSTAVNDIPEVIDERWEERAQFDCFFYTRSLDAENIESIQKISITNEIDGTTEIIVKP